MATPVRYFEVVEGSDSKFRILLAEKYARKFCSVVGNFFVSPAFKSKEEAEKVGWSYISSDFGQFRRKHSHLAAEKREIEAAQSSLF